MSETPVVEAEEQLSENELIALRREKLQQLRDAGQAYPNDFKPTHIASQCFEDYEAIDGEQLKQEQNPVKLAGRIMTRRLMGKASFVHLQDRSGKIQVYLRANDLPEGVYEQFKHWDMGDIIGVSGYVFKTKTGELSIHADAAELLVKSIRPMPDKFHGLTDIQMRYRQRYVDLMTNEATREVFRLRSQIVSFIRDFFIKTDFLEVETPMMQVIPGGAAAKPFKTWHNALDMELFLRIAPELNLKKLVVGGLDRVFEINRNFRNEGLSTQHNPEFTMLEFYQAYADYHDLMNLTEELLQALTASVLGETTIHYQGLDIDFSQPFARLTVVESILAYNKDITEAQLQDLEQAKAIAERLGITILPVYGLGKIQCEIFEKTVEEKLVQPTFITQYPTEVSPLARRSDSDPFVTDRFELFIAGREIANGFSELNDPDDQAARFKAQVEAIEAGDDEAMHYDADYVTALEYGLPPTAGEGIGIDRLVMLLTNQPSIRDVLLFPHMRPVE